MRANALALLLPLTLGLLSSPIQAQIYKTTDEHGNVVFSDQPPKDGAPSEEIDVSPTNTAPAAAVSAPAPKPDKAPEEPEASKPVVTITSPDNETTIPMGGGNFSVSASVSPSLDENQSLLLRIDGEPWGEPQASGGWQLTNVFRGAHDLTVDLLDSEGKTIVSSPGVRVYVLRPSVLN